MNKYLINKSLSKYIPEKIAQKELPENDHLLIETKLDEEDLREVIARAYCEKLSEEKNELFVTKEEMDNWDIVLDLMEKHGTTNAGIVETIPFESLYKTF